MNNTIYNDKSDPIFKQKEKARDGFIKILENGNKEIFPLAIYGDWGIGKTYFVNEVREKIEKDKPNLKVIIIDAYKGLFAEPSIFSVFEIIRNS